LQRCCHCCVHAKSWWWRWPASLRCQTDSPGGDAAASCTVHIMIARLASSSCSPASHRGTRGYPPPCRHAEHRGSFTTRRRQPTAACMLSMRIAALPSALRVGWCRLLSPHVETILQLTPPVRSLGGFHGTALTNQIQRCTRRPDSTPHSALSRCSGTYHAHNRHALSAALRCCWLQEQAPLPLEARPPADPERG
jgi:hypothetical protein